MRDGEQIFISRCCFCLLKDYLQQLQRITSYLIPDNGFLKKLPGPEKRVDKLMLILCSLLSPVLKNQDVVFYH